MQRIQIGTDIVSITRIERLSKRFGSSFHARFLQEEEMLHAKRMETLAGYWAAKEAAAKALGCGIGKELSFYDIMIKKDSKGAPSLHFSANIRQRFCIDQAALSISHDGGFAVASVIITFIKGKENENR